MGNAGPKPPPKPVVTPEQLKAAQDRVDAAKKKLDDFEKDKLARRDHVIDGAIKDRAKEDEPKLKEAKNVADKAIAKADEEEKKTIDAAKGKADAEVKQATAAATAEFKQTKDAANKKITDEVAKQKDVMAAKNKELAEAKKAIKDAEKKKLPKDATAEDKKAKKEEIKQLVENKKRIEKEVKEAKSQGKQAIANVRTEAKAEIKQAGEKRDQAIKTATDKAKADVAKATTEAKQKSSQAKSSAQKTLTDTTTKINADSEKYIKDVRHRQNEEAQALINNFRKNHGGELATAEAELKALQDAAKKATPKKGPAKGGQKSPAPQASENQSASGEAYTIYMNLLSNMDKRVGKWAGWMQKKSGGKLAGLLGPVAGLPLRPIQSGLGKLLGKKGGQSAGAPSESPTLSGNKGGGGTPNTPSAPSAPSEQSSAKSPGGFDAKLSEASNQRGKGLPSEGPQTAIGQQSANKVGDSKSQQELDNAASKAASDQHESSPTGKTPSRQDSMAASDPALQSGSPSPSDAQQSPTEKSGGKQESVIAYDPALKDGASSQAAPIPGSGPEMSAMPAGQQDASPINAMLRNAANHDSAAPAQPPPPPSESTSPTATATNVGP